MSFFNFPAAVDLEKQWVAFLVSRDGVVHNNSHICSTHFTQDRFVNFAQKALGFVEQLRRAPAAVPFLPPPQPLPEPGTSGNRGSCIVHSAKGASPHARGHVAALSVTLTILLRRNTDSKAFHNPPFCF